MMMKLKNVIPSNGKEVLGKHRYLHNLLVIALFSWTEIILCPL